MTTDNDSDSETTGDTPANPPTPFERTEVLDLLEDGLQEAHRKVVSGRVRDPGKEKVRQQWIRTLGYLAGQYRQLKKDEDLEELSERLDRVEQRDDTTGSSLQRGEV